MLHTLKRSLMLLAFLGSLTTGLAQSAAAPVVNNTGQELVGVSFDAAPAPLDAAPMAAHNTTTGIIFMLLGLTLGGGVIYAFMGIARPSRGSQAHTSKQDEARRLNARAAVFMHTQSQIERQRKSRKRASSSSSGSDSLYTPPSSLLYMGGNNSSDDGGRGTDCSPQASSGSDSSGSSCSDGGGDGGGGE